MCICSSLFWADCRSEEADRQMMTERAVAERAVSASKSCVFVIVPFGQIAHLKKQITSPNTMYTNCNTMYAICTNDRGP